MSHLSLLSPMKLANAFAPLVDLRYAIQTAFFPSLRALIKSPTLLLHPVDLSRLFMSHVWTTFGDSVDEGGREVKNRLLPNAQGVVLDIGAGHGHTVKYLDLQKVTKYIALEPNAHMHTEIRKTAAQFGFTEEADTLSILPYGAEDISQILTALEKPQSVDTLVSILTLCSIPTPIFTLKNLVEQVLKPGGQLLIYEHVLSPRSDVAWWQRFWTPVWRVAFDGCCLDRPTHLWLEDMDVWENKELWGKDQEDEENLWWHQAGTFVKRAQT